MHGRKHRIMCLTGLAAVLLTGCSSSPDSLAGTAWKITSLTTPSGTEYDEAAYDMIIGETVYRFDADGKMTAGVGDAAEQLIYDYTYEKGRVEIRSEQLQCNGRVKRNEMKLQLEERGEAVLTQLPE